MSAPQSVIHICAGLRIDSSYNHSIYFANASAQQEFFAGKVVKTLSAYSYLRKSWPLKVAASMEEAKTWSYLFFRNAPSGKVYYYFIDTVEYINDGTVELGLTLDVIQTYMFDYWHDHSFIERMHTPTDNIGEHTVDEGLELGELVTSGFENLIEFNDCCILILSTIYLNGASASTTLPAYSQLYNNTFSGLYISAVNYSDWAALGKQLENLSTWGKIDGVISMWMYPKSLVTLAGESTWTDGVLAKAVGSVKTVSLSLASNVGSAQGLNGYVPRNKKLWCYPYNFLYVTNNNGGSASYQFERFDVAPGSAVQFICMGALSPDAGMKLSPVRYKGTVSINYDEGLTFPPFPTCAWDADLYKMWLAQNQASHELVNTQGATQIAAGTAVTTASAFMLDGDGIAQGTAMVTSGANQIANLVAAKKDASVQPPQSRGAFTASICRANAFSTYSYTFKTITAEYATIIDRYFDMYGYRINRYAVPNIAARPNYTYVKTIGCNIHGNLCNEDLAKIRSIYDRGITFWKNGNEVGNYALPNSV